VQVVELDFWKLELQVLEEEKLLVEVQDFCLSLKSLLSVKSEVDSSVKLVHEELLSER